jgi:hypothetical protein
LGYSVLAISFVDHPVENTYWLAWIDWREENAWSICIFLRLDTPVVLLVVLEAGSEKYR